MFSKIITPSTVGKDFDDYRVEWHHWRFIGARQFSDGNVYAVMHETSGLDAGTQVTVFASADTLQTAIDHVESLQSPAGFFGGKPNPLAVILLDDAKSRVVANLRDIKTKTDEHIADSALHVGEALHPIYDTHFAYAMSKSTHERPAPRGL